MNKLNKIGLSALCGSLASVTAYAGTLDVTGSAEATYTSRGGEVTGNPIGMKSNLSFVGNGELDGSQTQPLFFFFFFLFFFLIEFFSKLSTK
jgi:hypothetical protein